jgi:predicted dehydrogenase
MHASKLPLTRRRFMRAATAAAAAASLASIEGRAATAPAAASRKSPADKLNVACIGLRGPGYGHLRELIDTEKIVALCDVDNTHMSHTVLQVSEAGHPEILKAKRYQDYRKMFAEMADQIDAVVVATPDHHHFPAAMLAIKHRKHVFVQKPLTRTVGEARALKEAARAAGVVTQMGNQYHASEGIRLVREWFELGLLGEVREVVAWVPGNASRFLHRPAAIPPAPGFIDTQIDWDVWLGPSPQREFSPGVYHAKRWRGWWDFGTGLLGDWACHTLDAPYWALQLGAPTSIEAEVSELNPWFVPKTAVIRYEFPARGKLPPVKLTWYEGGPKPAPPRDWEQGKPLPAAGMMMLGSRNTLITGTSPESPRLVSTAAMDELKRNRPKRWLDRVPGGHIAEWIRAMKGAGPSPGSNFVDYAADLTQVALLGVVAMRTGKRLEWDNRAARIANDAALNQHLEIQARDGWQMT